MNAHDHQHARQGARPTLPPVAAGLLSLVAPGVGHLLAGLWGRGAIWLVGWFVIGAAGPHSFPMVALMVISGLDAYFCARARAAAVERTGTRGA